MGVEPFGALVVFHGHGVDRLAGWLHPQFRHCFLAVRRGGHWLAFDGQAGLPEIRLVGPAGIDLARHYRLLGYGVVSVAIERTRPRCPWMLGTCVGGVKRMLGIRAPWVLTPRQLHRYLSKGDMRCRRSFPRRSPPGFRYRNRFPRTRP